MRAHKKQFIEWTLLIVLWLSAIPGWSQEEVPFAEENTYITVSGDGFCFRNFTYRLS